MKYTKILLTMSLFAFFAACSSTPVAVESETGDAVGIVDRVYFDFDKSDIKPESIEVLDQHADAIKKAVETNPDLVVRIEGHCDERGTIDYNFALGNRRAQAVSRYLRVKGVPANSIETISYGEEQPARNESNGAAWALNRRAVLVY